jgi:hypothetical protein
MVSRHVSEGNRPSALAGARREVAVVVVVEEEEEEPTHTVHAELLGEFHAGEMFLYLRRPHR